MPDPTDTPIASASRAIVGSLVRGGLKVAGAALVTHGVLTQGQVDTFVPAVAQEVVGALLVGGSQAWGIVRAWWSHTRWAAAVQQLLSAGIAPKV